ncbi:MAG: response regulator, partial [Rhodospirillales bacterium]
MASGVYRLLNDKIHTSSTFRQRSLGTRRDMNGQSINWNSYTMLIADDNSHFRWLMRSFLNKYGVGSVVEAANGADAIQVLHKTPVDVALV